MSRFRTSLCRGCGKPIVWGTDENGKRIPLDPRAPVYLVVEGVNGYELKRVPQVLVTHFATCSKAQDFSGRSAKRAAAANEEETW